MEGKKTEERHHGTDTVGQESGNFFYNGPVNRNFQLCRLHSSCCNYSRCHGRVRAVSDYTYMNKHGCVPIKS